jgi:hypothetical protein
MAFFPLGLSSPFDTIYHLQPLMALATLPLAIGIEGWYKMFTASVAWEAYKDFFLVRKFLLLEEKKGNNLITCK